MLLNYIATVVIEKCPSLKMLLFFPTCVFIYSVSVGFIDFKAK